jgi:hypothetical protein
MAAFPPNALKCILLLTNKTLQKKKEKEIELGELLQFFRMVTTKRLQPILPMTWTLSSGY